MHLALIHDLINKDAKVILHSKLILRGGKVFFLVSLSLGICDQYLLFNVFVSELLLYIIFYCVEVTRSTHSDGNGFAMAKAKD